MFQKFIKSDNDRHRKNIRAETIKGKFKNAEENKFYFNLRGYGIPLQQRSAQPIFLFRHVLFSKLR